MAFTPSRGNAGLIAMARSGRCRSALLIFRGAADSKPFLFARSQVCRVRPHPRLDKGASQEPHRHPQPPRPAYSPHTRVRLENSVMASAPYSAWTYV